MEPIRGIRMGRQPSSPEDGGRCFDGERQLLAAIIIRAVQESESGNTEASAWLQSTGREWCEKLLGIEEPGRMLPLAAARRLCADPAAQHERDLRRWRACGARARERQRIRRESEEVNA